jgi:3-oxoacyl-[acyl-carrier-protein] synthase-3
MAANAVREAAERAGLGPNDVELLTAATTGPDMLAPGHAGMVHASWATGRWRFRLPPESVVPG